MHQIESPFDASRNREWTEVIRFLEDLPRKGWLMDLASGNGRHTLPAARLGHRVVAVDVARGLLRRSRSRLEGEELLRGNLFVEADALRLPIADGSIDAAIFIAGLHCIRGKKTRRASLVELCRVLKPGAPLLLTVWWRDPKRFRGPLKRNQARLDRQEQIPTDPGATRPPEEPGDVSMPWRHGVEVPVDRYFHLYEERELEQDLLAARFDAPRVEYMRFASTWNLVATTQAPGTVNRDDEVQPEDG